MPALGRRRPMVQREERGGRDEVGRGVDRERRSQPEPNEDRSAERRAGQVPDLPRDLGEPARGGQLLGADHLLEQRGDRRPEDAVAEADHERQHVEGEERRRACEREGRHRRHKHEAHEVGSDRQRAPRVAVGERPGERQHDDARPEPERPDQGDRRRRSRPVEQIPAEGDDVEPRARHREHLPDEVEPEIPVTQRGKRVHVATLAAPMIEPGQPAPDFALESDTGETIRLSDLRGGPVVVYFYPKDDTSGCTTQACDIRDNWGEFEQAGATVLGISPDSAESHAKFRANSQAAVPAPRRRRPRGRRGLRRLGREEELRQDVRRHHPVGVRDRRGRQPGGRRSTT